MPDTPYDENQPEPPPAPGYPPAPNPWAPPGTSAGATPPPPPTPPLPYPQAPSGYPPPSPAGPPPYPAAPPGYQGPPPGGIPTGAEPQLPPPVVPPTNRLPLLVALAALVVVAVVAGVVFALSRGDGDEAVTVDEAIAPQSARVDVSGSDLPTADAPSSDPRDDVAVDEIIPTITGVDLAGAPMTIEPGRRQLIVVMAHWCPHCQAEIPRIVDWAAEGRVPDDVDIVGISTAHDEARGNYPPASWLQRERWAFPTLLDDPDATALHALGATGFPTLIAVRADGSVGARSSGESDLATFTTLIEATAGSRARGSQDPASSPDTEGNQSGDPADCPPTDGSSPRRTEFDRPQPRCIDPDESYRAVVTTNLGEFTIELDPESAPDTVNNFVVLARYRFFDGVVFHRIIEDFMFQGGDPEGTGMGGPGYEFADEVPRRPYRRYDVAMANAGPDTNGSQFFVITGTDGESLPPQYSLFGTVVLGTDVADAIGSVATDVADRPLDAVVIEHIEIVEGS